MASLNYLWHNRYKHKIGTLFYFKAWAKRILTFKELLKRNYRRRLLISKGAKVEETAEMGEVSIYGSKDKLLIGKESFLGKVEIALHDRVSIGSRVCINDGVRLLTASHYVNDPEWNLKYGEISIGDYAWIAVNAVILPGVSIGKGAVVGAGAVVSKNIDEYEIVVGNPARSLGKKRVVELNYNPCEFLAANAAWLKP